MKQSAVPFRKPTLAAFGGGRGEDGWKEAKDKEAGEE